MPSLSSEEVRAILSNVRVIIDAVLRPTPQTKTTGFFASLFGSTTAKTINYNEKDKALVNKLSDAFFLSKKSDADTAAAINKIFDDAFQQGGLSNNIINLLEDRKLIAQEKAAALKKTIQPAESTADASSLRTASLSGSS